MTTTAAARAWEDLRDLIPEVRDALVLDDDSGRGPSPATMAQLARMLRLVGDAGCSELDPLRTAALALKRDALALIERSEQQR